MRSDVYFKMRFNKAISNFVSLTGRSRSRSKSPTAYRPAPDTSGFEDAVQAFSTMDTKRGLELGEARFQSDRSSSKEVAQLRKSRARDRPAEASIEEVSTVTRKTHRFAANSMLKRSSFLLIRWLNRFVKFPANLLGLENSAEVSEGRCVADFGIGGRAGIDWKLEPQSYQLFSWCDACQAGRWHFTPVLRCVRGAAPSAERVRVKSHGTWKPSSTVLHDIDKNRAIVFRFPRFRCSLRSLEILLTCIRCWRVNCPFSPSVSRKAALLWRSSGKTFTRSCARGPKLCSTWATSWSVECHPFSDRLILLWNGCRWTLAERCTSELLLRPVLALWPCDRNVLHVSLQARRPVRLCLHRTQRPASSSQPTS